RIVITDFGVARAVLADESDGLGTTGFAAIGTPAYMAPEQVEGAHDVDGRADIYALGVTLYELVTGARAWRGRTIFEVASKRLTLPPPDVGDLAPAVPAELAEIIKKCMARDRAHRWATAKELALALAHHCSTTSPPTPPLVEIERRPLPAKTIAVLPFRNAGPDGDAY